MRTSPQQLKSRLTYTANNLSKTNTQIAKELNLNENWVGQNLKRLKLKRQKKSILNYVKTLNGATSNVITAILPSLSNPAQYNKAHGNKNIKRNLKQKLIYIAKNLSKPNHEICTALGVDSTYICSTLKRLKLPRSKNHILNFAYKLPDAVQQKITVMAKDLPSHKKITNKVTFVTPQQHNFTITKKSPKSVIKNLRYLAKNIKKPLTTVSKELGVGKSYFSNLLNRNNIPHTRKGILAYIKHNKNYGATLVVQKPVVGHVFTKSQLDNVIFGGFKKITPKFNATKAGTVSKQLFWDDVKTPATNTALFTKLSAAQTNNELSYSEQTSQLLLGISGLQTGESIKINNHLINPQLGVFLCSKEIAKVATVKYLGDSTLIVKK